MRPQEAIPILERLQEPKAWEPQISSDAFEALELAIEALKKEVPQQPMKSIDTFSESLYKLYCPTCGNYIAYGNSRVGTLNKFTKATDRCGYCGQKIDFER
jgi:hypothetical protein